MIQKNQGYCDVLIGLQYGDEGKAKIIDMLAENYDVVARFNGGVNAGHTIVTDRGTLALRLIPSAVEHEHCQLYIGSGCVISPGALIKEIGDISSAGYAIKHRLTISPNATIVLPHHVILDRLHGDDIGTTGNGIGPAYADRALRLKEGILSNVRMIDLLTSPERVVEIAQAHLGRLANLSPEHQTLGQLLMTELADSIPELQPLISTTNDFLTKRLQGGARVLFEGAQSYMLDVVNGDVPFVTSSQTGVSAAYTGGDVPPMYHRQAIGIVKLVMSRVGKGPFPSELGGDASLEYCTTNGGKTHTRDYERANFNPLELIASGEPFKVGQALRMFSGEYGTGSGRPRRIGMMDIAQLQAAVESNGINALYLTKCDCLRDYAKTPDKTIPVVLPSVDPLRLAIKRYPAFESSLDECQTFSELPDGLVALIADIEKISGSPVVGIGVGPHRSQMILRDRGRLIPSSIPTGIEGELEPHHTQTDQNIPRSM